MRLTLIRLELAASTLLIGVAAGWSALRGVDLGALLRPTAADVGIGVAFGLVLAIVLPMITAPWARHVFLLRGLRQAWDVLESGLGPRLTTAEVLVLALGAAISEELFFRGIVQAELGLPAASLLFGLLHPLGLAYVVWATVAGAGLGILCMMTGSLIAPAAAHGTYNLLALVYLRRRSQR
jgi:membrane protease YdiL (CAAX protease family)